MSEGRCVRCARPCGGGLCMRCGRKLADLCRGAAVLALELEIDITRQNTTHPPALMVSGSGDPAAPFDIAASETLWSLGNTLATWITELRDHGHLAPEQGRIRDSPGRSAEVALMARFLSEHVVELMKLSDIGQCYDEIEYAVNLATRTIDLPEQRAYLGDCGCGNRLYDDGDVSDEVICRRCHARHDMRSRRQSNRYAARNVLLTAAMLQRILGRVYGVDVTAQRVRVWAGRGHFPDYGRDPETGAKLYRVGDVLDYLEERYEHSPASDVINTAYNGG